MISACATASAGLRLIAEAAPSAEIWHNCSLEKLRVRSPRSHGDDGRKNHFVEGETEMIESDPVFVGYLAKIIEPRPEWLKAPAVDDICSVSECISKAPANRWQAWKHNEYGFYESQDDAWSVIASEARRYDMFAFEALCFRGLDGRIDSAKLACVAGQIPVDFEFLGFDIVTRSGDASMECSPLSCNRVAESIATNSHCLIASEELAIEALQMISAPGFGAEPGPYYLFKVYRQVRKVSPRE